MMGAPMKQYKLVKRYMRGTETVYYGLMSSDGIERKFTEEQTYFLVGRGAVINITGQLYKDKVLLRGDGIDIRDLPVVQIGKDYSTSSNIRQTNITETKQTNPSYDYKVIEIIKNGRQNTYKIIDKYNKTSVVSKEQLAKLISDNRVVNARLQLYKGNTIIRLKNDIPIIGDNFNQDDTTTKTSTDTDVKTDDYNILLKPIDMNEAISVDINKLGVSNYNDKQVVIVSGGKECDLLSFRGKIAKLNRNLRLETLKTFSFCTNQNIINCIAYNNYTISLYDSLRELDLNKSYSLYQNALQYTTTDFAYNIGDDSVIKECIRMGNDSNSTNGLIELIHKQKDRNIIHIIDPIPNGSDRYFCISDTTLICLKAAFRERLRENIKNNSNFENHKFMRMHYHDIIVWMDNIVFMPEYKKLKLAYLKYNKEVFDNKLNTNVVLFAQYYNSSGPEETYGGYSTTIGDIGVININCQSHNLGDKISNSLRNTILHEMCHVYTQQIYGTCVEDPNETAIDLGYFKGEITENRKIQSQFHGRKFKEAVDMVAAKTGIYWGDIFGYGNSVTKYRTEAEQTITFDCVHSNIEIRDLFNYFVNELSNIDIKFQSKFGVDIDASIKKNKNNDEYLCIRLYNGLFRQIYLCIPHLDVSDRFDSISVYRYFEDNKNHANLISKITTKGKGHNDILKSTINCIMKNFLVEA